MSTNSSEERKYYPFLDGFRTLAVLWVLAYHIILNFGLRETAIYQSNKTLFLILDHGFLGVDLFFVISGFLITGLLINDLKTNIRIKRFYVRRFFKIIPHYYFAIFTGISIVAFTQPEFLGNGHIILGYFLFFVNYIPRIPGIDHAWTIAIEEHFYFFMPLLLWVVCRLKSDFRSRKFLLLWIFLGLIVLGNLLRFYYCPSEEFLKYPARWQMTQYRFDALVFGCLIKLLEPILSKRENVLTNLIAFFCFFGALFIFGYISLNFNYMVWYHYTLAYIASGLLIISGLKRFAPLKWIAENRLFIWVGKSSYGIYLWHVIILYPLRQFIGHYNTVLLILIFIFLSLFIGILSTATVEKYFLNLRKRIAP